MRFMYIYETHSITLAHDYNYLLYFTDNGASSMTFDGKEHVLVTLFDNHALKKKFKSKNIKSVVILFTSLVLF